MNTQAAYAAGGAWLALNLVAFVLYGLDKRRARRGAWRVSEAMLLGATALGPLGGWMGSAVFRHKTRKLLFRFGMVLATAVHVALLWGLWTLTSG